MGIIDRIETCPSLLWTAGRHLILTYIKHYTWFYESHYEVISISDMYINLSTPEVQHGARGSDRTFAAEKRLIFLSWSAEMFSPPSWLIFKKNTCFQRSDFIIGLDIPKS